MGEPQNIDDIMNMIAELDSNIVALIARLDSAEARAAAAERERDELRETVIAFAGPHAVNYAKDFDLPAGHLHPMHYDILARCGARMDDFTRADLDTQPR